mgnify:CR=1 FL=1
MAKPALLITGSLLPLIDNGVEPAFEVPRLPAAESERPAFLASVGPRIDAIATGAMTGVRTTSEMIAHCPKLRIIANFGVGYDVNSRLLDRLSREHRGQSEYVRPEENLEVHVSRLYKKISAPVMTDVAVKFEFDTPTSTDQGPSVTRLYTSVLPDLFEGEQLVVVGRATQRQPEGSLHLAIDILAGLA